MKNLASNSISTLSLRSNQEMLIRGFFEGRNERTLVAYRTDIENFRAFLGCPTMEEAMVALFGSSHGHANLLVHSYKAHLIKEKLQPTSINRRLSTLRSLSAFARTIGMVPWQLEVSNLKVKPYRDTRGPGQSNFERILKKASSKGDAKAARDHAILRLLFDLALRASEVVNLDLADLDLEARTVAVLGKGRTQKELLTLPKPTAAALGLWLEKRHDPSGSLDALFLNFDRTNKGQSKRLTRVGLYKLVRELGEKLNIKARPHGIRHTSITEACKLAQKHGYGLEEVLDHSRHSNVSTLMIYRDRETNAQGAIATLVADTTDIARKK